MRRISIVVPPIEGYVIRIRARSVQHHRFEIEGELGRGSQGVVHRAVHMASGRVVALKRIAAGTLGAAADLKSEFRARVDLHHPNLVQLYELHVDHGVAEISMELIEDARTFAVYVREQESLLRERFVRSGYEVLSALHTLHEAGFVHRDIKPSNVLVDGHGTARLTDFGFAVRWQSDEDDGEMGISGTLAYLAPELRLGGHPRPGADIFAAGIMFAEALTGVRPEISTLRPARISRDLAEDARPLVERMLALDPRNRLTASEAASELLTLAETWGLPSPGPNLQVSERPCFVGRETELAHARETITRRGASTLLYVLGPSGIGKSTFVERLLGELDPTTFTVLRGRCHPQELHPLRAWDEVADQLARRARRGQIAMPDAPQSVHALARLLPGLGLTSIEATPSAPIDAELRRIAVRALIEVFASLAPRRVVLWLDDVQWAGADSITLLQDLFDAGLKETSVVLSFRDDVPIALSVGTDAHSVSLPPLSATAVRALMDHHGIDASMQHAASTLASLPMFARDFARAESSSRASGDDVTVSALLEQRLAHVAPRLRELLRMVSMSPRPLPWAVLEAAATTRTDLFPDVLSLRQAGVLRQMPDVGGAQIWTYHDLLRDALRRTISDDEQRVLHEHLAAAYASEAPEEHEARAHHAEGAGDLDAASEHLVASADRARLRLAFATASSSYARAMELRPALAEDWSVQSSLASCDAALGKAAAAGERYAGAAALAERAGARADGIDLRRRGARELILCGRLDAGYGLLQSVMRRIGVRLPMGPLSTLVWSLVLRARLLMRGSGARSLPRRPASDEENAVLDALWAGCTSFSHVNPALADVFLLRHALLASRVGDPHRLAKSLTFEAVAEVTLGVDRLLPRIDTLMTRARSLCAEHGDDYDWGWYWTSETSRAVFEARWPSAIQSSITAEAHFERRGHGVAWELSVVRIYRAIALSMTGDVATLGALVEAVVVDGKKRADPVAVNGVTSGHPAILRLFRGDAEDVVSGEIIARGLSWPAAAFTAPDYYDLVARAERVLYRGDGCAALDIVTAAWKSLEDAQLLALRFVGVDSHYLRARCAWAARSDRPGAIDIVKGAARRLSKSREPLAGAYARALRSALALHRSAMSDHMQHMRNAEAAFAALDMRAHAAAAALGVAIAMRDADGARVATGALRDLGAHDPLAIARMLVPGIDDDQPKP